MCSYNNKAKINKFNSSKYKFKINNNKFKIINNKYKINKLRNNYYRI